MIQTITPPQRQSNYANLAITQPSSTLLKMSFITRLIKKPLIYIIAKSIELQQKCKNWLKSLRKSTLTVTSVECSPQRVCVKFKVRGPVKEYFIKNSSFFAEYSDDIVSSDKSLAVIPFLCNVLPIIWLTNTSLIVPEIDKSFLESVRDIKKGYMEMYPMLTFKGKIIAQDVVDNSHVDTSSRANNGTDALTFFSGGVDAFNTLISHASKNPILFSVWGADIELDDTAGWQNVENHASKVAKDFSTKAIFVKSNLRHFIKRLFKN